MEPSIFTKIINGEIPCYKVEENEHFIAFLDVFPLVKGHTLVVPKKQVDYLFDLDEETYTGLWQFSQKVARKIEAAIPCTRIGVAVVGLEVPHAHIHLVPIDGVGDINFSKPKLKLTPAEFDGVLNAINS